VRRVGEPCVKIGLDLLLVLTFLGAPRPARADPHYFLGSYTPYPGETQELEVETWVTARVGKQDPSLPAAWESRLEIEYALTNRLSGAAYVNFDGTPGADPDVRSGSLEIIDALASPGRLPGDPALYLEVTESGHELELEPKLLVGWRSPRWVMASNLVGEFEFRHDRDEKLDNGDVLTKAAAGEITGGVAYEVGRRVAVGVETRYRAEFPNFTRHAASLFSLGPTVSLRLGKGQAAVSLLPQVWGHPPTAGRRNLTDFEKLQIRTVVGVEF
jgi:hypothetical protein